MVIVLVTGKASRVLSMFFPSKQRGSTANPIRRGQSPIAEYIWAPKGISGRWNALPKAAQIAIVAGAIGLGVVLLALLTFCCIKQRRAGRREKALADAEFDKGAAELMEYRNKQGAVSILSSAPSSYSTPTKEYPPPLPSMPSQHIMEPGRPMKSGWL